MTARRFWAALCLLALLALCGCGGTPLETTAEILPQTTAPQTIAPETTVPVTEAIAPVEYTDPLTGLPVEAPIDDRRPVAVMLNNLKDALPMQGNSEAAILYEMLAEGGITRLIGVYSTLENVGEIGSIRSARPYFIEVAMGHDALFIHAGASDDGYISLRDWKVDHMDGVNGAYSSASAGVFYRDRNRLGGKYASEHSMLSTGERILTAWQSSNMRETHNEGFDAGLLFTDTLPTGGETASVVTVPFSANYKTGVFTYDSERGMYGVEEYGKAFTDGNTGEQIFVKNLLILRVKYTYSGDSKGHMYADLTRGEGYYAVGGKIVPITWEKGKYSDPIRYFDADGQPLALARGNSYVCMAPTSQEVSWK